MPARLPLSTADGLEAWSVAVGRVQSVSRHLLSRTLSRHLHTPALGASALKAQAAQGMSIGRVVLSVSRHMYGAFRDQTDSHGSRDHCIKGIRESKMSCQRSPLVTF